MAKSLSFPCCRAVFVALLVAFTDLSRASMESFSCYFTFFMHDISGGSASSERVVAGITVATADDLPFSKPIHRIFPIPGGIPLVDNNPNPSTTTSAVISDVDTHNNVVIDNANMLPYVKPGALPLGATLLDKVLFGRVTVMDYEVTRGRDVGSKVIGRAQGFHLASSWDGTSKTVAFTVLLADEEEDTISFFGVHRTAEIESGVAVVGGTGKYENAKGYAKLEIGHLLPGQQIRNGVDAVVQTTVYLTLHTSP
ncbi:dirigent protein 9-like [Neltuma alba]|uniref:dirigent protein 9-like n=1 Tax=Neltuma alba TaxID=207710 RepID=UPI0010A3922A|nr:dirigent protein 9-like [Prosopis alba]